MRQIDRQDNEDIGDLTSVEADDEQGSHQRELQDRGEGDGNAGTFGMHGAQMMIHYRQDGGMHSSGRRWRQATAGGFYAYGPGGFGAGAQETINSGSDTDE